MEATEGMPYRLVGEGQLSCELLSVPEEIINHTLKKRKQNFPHIKGNSDGIGCKVMYEEELP
jgi:hypothetical protein